MRILVIFAVSLLWMSACSTPSINMDYKNAITDSKAGKIRVGVTTKDELVAMFGPPETKMRSSDKVIYFFKDLSLNSLWVVFDKDSIVEEFERSN